MLAIILLHPLLILIKGYFLSAEFTLYPYLISKGLLPYRDIIDQHFPSLFFGPFSLPYFLTDNPTKLLFLFFTILALSDLLLYQFLSKAKVPHPQLLLLLYIFVSFYFSGSILWIEVFVNFFLLIWLSLRGQKKPWRYLFSGLLLSQVLLLRPTFAPSLLFLFFYFESLNFYYLLGGIVGILLPAFYLQANHLWIDFYYLAFIFNSQVYPLGAKLFPSIREIVIIFTLLLSSVYSSQKILIKLALLFSLILAYPRFGLEHLQPFVLIVILTLSQIKNQNLIRALIIIFGLLNLLSVARHHYGNYFYPPDLYQIAAQVKSLPSGSIYLLGASDLIYPLSGKLPPKNFYLPSLPWYLNEPFFQQKLFASLQYPGSQVLLDTNYTVDGKTLAQSSPAIINFIEDQFTLVQEFSHYRLYQIKP